MIPKKIHYCWFGGQPLPELAQLCIESWRRFLPNYEIIRWDESNYDVNKIPYISEAYAAKKYAFVSDYARFDILYQYGGLYFDTDVEIIKDLSEIVENGAFMGCENSVNGYLINAGLGLGAVPQMAIYKEILEDYQQRHFFSEAKQQDLTTVVEIVSHIFERYNFNTQNNKIQKINDVTIYPPMFFCPQNGWFNRYKLSKDTYSIHHYAASWMSAGGKFRARLSKMIGYENYNRLKRFIHKQ
jgi:mannosyltransferase OCH1-like enzyme